MTHTHTLIELKERLDRSSNPQEYVGNFWRYVTVDGLTPEEFKITKLPNSGVSKVRISFSDKPIPNKKPIQFSLNRNSPEWAELSVKGPKEDWDYFNIGALVVNDLGYPLQMQTNGGVGPIFSKETGLMETLVLLHSREYLLDYDSWFAKDPMHHVPGILKHLQRGQNYTDISLFALYNDILDKELPLWKVPESRLVKKGHYVIE